MKHLIFLLAAITIFSCGKDNRPPNKIQVKYEGALKRMMHKGDISAKADLKDFENTEHLYALGAIENLKGEVLIVDGQPYHTMVVDDTLAFDHTFDKKATLFVYASISKWKSINIPDDVVTYDQLEEYIGKTAEENQIRVDEPFPFLIKGTPKSFDWHVINWKDGDTEHSHEKHINSGLHGTIQNRAIEMLGFYSDSHHAIFTHHTTNMHIHMKTVDNLLAGHVDGLTLGSGMVLMLPDLE